MNKTYTTSRSSRQEHWYRFITEGEHWKPYLIRKGKMAAPMLIFMLLYCIGFKLLENWNRLHYTLIHTQLDDLIPFVEIFILPYLFWFIYMVLFTVYLAMFDEENYHRLCTFLAIGMTAFLIVSLFFPNILVLRPETMPRDNVFTRLCSFLYSIDTPTNVTPSIHVYNSIAVMITVWYSDAKVLGSKVSKVIITLLGALICLSTMFIKQHSVSDVIVATGMSIAVYIAVFRMDVVFDFQRRRKAISHRPRTVRT